MGTTLEEQHSSMDHGSVTETASVQSTATANEKTQIDKKLARKKRLAVILTFFSLQLSLFLAALDK